MPTILDQLLGNGQMDAPPNTAQQILSARFQQPQDTTGGNTMMPAPTFSNFQASPSDAAQAIFRNTTGFNGNPSYNPISPQQAYGENQMAVIQPYNEMMQAQGRQLQNGIVAQTGLPMAQADLQRQLMANSIQQQTGLQGAQADIANKNAMAGYYGNALQRDIAEKQFQYANDPQMAQARMMATYMQQMNGRNPPQQQPQQISVQPQSTPPGPISMGGYTPSAVDASSLAPGAPTPPMGNIPMPAPSASLPQVLQQNAQTANAPATNGSGFNPMGAMLAKSLGLTDMQIGPNGQPMPIPGSMKIENGSVISFDANGKPQSNIPVNPRAQGLFEQKLSDIYQNVEALHKINGTIEEGGGFGQYLQNKGTQIAATKGNDYIPGGQDILQGTQAQTIRDNINADVKQALPLYMQAFGITPGMERAQAAQQMLQDAIGGALNKSRQHTISNLKNLSQTAGTGQLAATLSQPIKVISPDGTPGTISAEELQPALANGWKQAQ